MNRTHRKPPLGNAQLLKRKPTAESQTDPPQVNLSRSPFNGQRAGPEGMVNCNVGGMLME